jgi:hypothetical protein
LYGKVVKAACSSHIRLFCPDLSYVDQVPAYGDNYLVDVPTLSAAEFKRRFARSVLRAESGFDIDLTVRANVLRLLRRIRRVDTQAVSHFASLVEECEFWNAIKIYYVCSEFRDAAHKASLSTYPLFLHLGGSKTALLQELSKLRGVPPSLIFSALLTYLWKMKKIDRVTGISWRYRRDLLDVRARISDVKRKLYRYLKSDKEMSDLLYLVLSL